MPSRWVILIVVFLEVDGDLDFDLACGLFLREAGGSAFDILMGVVFNFFLGVLSLGCLYGYWQVNLLMDFYLDFDRLLSTAIPALPLNNP